MLYPENHMKYNGHIISNKKSYVFMYKKSGKKIYSSKHIFEDEESKLESYKNAVKSKKQYSINNNLKIINKYIEFEKDFYKINTYDIKNPNSNMIVDKKDLCLVDKYIWTIKNGNYHPTAYIKLKKDISDIKDILLKNNQNYNFDLINNYNYISFIKFKYGTTVKNIIFKNKNRFDYRSKNINIIKKNIFFLTNIKNRIKDTLPNKVNDLYIIKEENDIYWEVRARKNNDNIIRRYSFNKLGRLISKNRANAFAEKLRHNNYELL